MDSPGRHHCQRVAEAVERVAGGPPDCGPDAVTLDSIRRTVEAWPALTAEQCDRLALILRPAPGEDGNGRGCRGIVRVPGEAGETSTRER